MGAEVEGPRFEEDDSPAPDAGVETSGAHNRAAPRTSMFLQATILCMASGERYPLRVRNISAGGLMADCSHEFSPGDRVELDVRGVRQQAGQIAWAGHGKLGVSFDDPINPSLARRPVTTESGTPRLQVAESAWRPGLRIR